MSRASSRIIAGSAPARESSTTGPRRSTPTCARASSGSPAWARRARSTPGWPPPRRAVSCSISWPCPRSTFLHAGVTARRSPSGRWPLWPILPVHAIYAGFILRESLVALVSIVAVWTLTEVLHAQTGRQAFAWALAAGASGGLAVLARTTGLALLAAAGPLRCGDPRQETLRPALALGRHGRTGVPALGLGHLSRVPSAFLFVYQLL